MGFFNAAICDDSSAIGIYLRYPEGMVKALKMLI